MQLQNYPNVTAFQDRMGQARYRYRKQGRTVYINGLPGTPEFDAAYKAAQTGQKIAKPRASSSAKNSAPPTALVIPMRGQTVPKSFGAAYEYLKKSQEWRDMSDTTHGIYRCEIELFLSRKVVPGGKSELIWRDVPVRDMRYVHLNGENGILSDDTIKPHARRLWLILIRKLIQQSMKLEWCEADPASGIVYSANASGRNRPWTPKDHKMFCDYWKPGTQARTCYALASWLGTRRGDIAALRNADRDTVKMKIDGKIVWADGFWVYPEKGRKRRIRNGKDEPMFLPMTPFLAEALAPLDPTTEFVLTNTLGKGYIKRSLTEIMKRSWVKKAGIKKGICLHGLRHGLGAVMADAGVDTRGAMAQLGHVNEKHARRYSEGADQRRKSYLAMQAVTEYVMADSDLPDATPPARPKLRLVG